MTAIQNAPAAENNLKKVQFESEQAIAKAKGEAEAVRIQVQAIQQQGGKDYVALKAIEAWDGKLPTYMLGGNALPFFKRFRLPARTSDTRDLLHSPVMKTCRASRAGFQFFVRARAVPSARSFRSRQDCLAACSLTRSQPSGSSAPHPRLRTAAN